MTLGTVEVVSGGLSCAKFVIARSDRNARLEDLGRECGKRRVEIGHDIGRIRKSVDFDGAVRRGVSFDSVFDPE
jgi:hypothetical protein